MEPPEDEQPMTLDSPAHFKALGHPVRHKMVNALRQRPATLRQLSEVTGLAKGTVSHHVQVLRQAGLVRVAETRQVRGGTEQSFALVSRGFRLSEEQGGGRFLVEAALAEMLPEQDDATTHTRLDHLWLTPAQARALVESVESRAPHPDQDGDHGEAYGLLVSLYRADIPRLAPEQS
ncbi:ArsR/SmtB family transcription factor [Kitasatospora sp. NPDC096147]|uniref:ArsR/SmtB family transcription factor n=1 Tax=Kitasatospora sp. NPDC096147 TaxID=3364093 RepID=UPI0038243D2E